MAEEAQQTQEQQTQEQQPEAQPEQQQPEQKQGQEQTQAGEGNANEQILGGEPEKKEAGDKPSKPEPLTADKIKYPEGVKPTQEEADEYIKLANDLGLTQEQAQKMLEQSYAARKREREATLAEAKNTITECSKAWAAEARKKFANNWDEVVSASRESYSKYATKGFMQIMRETGLGNNPEVIETFYNIGKALRSDRIVNNSIPDGQSSNKDFSRWYKDK